MELLEDGTFGTAPLKEYPVRVGAATLASVWASYGGIDGDDFGNVVLRLQIRCHDIDEELVSTPWGMRSLPADLDLFLHWAGLCFREGFFKEHDHIKCHARTYSPFYNHYCGVRNIVSCL